MQFIAVEKRSLSKKYFALEEIAEKLAPDLLEDIHMYKEKKLKEDSANSSFTKIEIDLNEHPQPPKIHINLNQDENYF